MTDAWNGQTRTARLATSGGMGARILLVEDDESFARALVRMMAANGYQVFHASTGEAAIASVMMQSFDAVLSDLNLPDSCGVDILRVARAQDPNVSLVLMSGDPTVETAIEAVGLGVFEYLVKPMTRERLARVLGRATTGRRPGIARRRGPASLRGEKTPASVRGERSPASVRGRVEPRGPGSIRPAKLSDEFAAMDGED